MSAMDWRLCEAAARLLPAEEREAVLGDLAEAGETGWRGFRSVMGLAIRRECEPWRGWQPWATGFGLALPSSFLLMGSSVGLSLAFQQLTATQASDAERFGIGLAELLCHAMFVAGLAWCGGLVVASVSRRTLWASALLCVAPCCFCLSRFRVAALSPWCLTLFLAPAMVGVACGLRGLRIRYGKGLALATGLTVLALTEWGRSAIFLDVLLWPAWYLAALELRTNRN